MILFLILSLTPTEDFRYAKGLFEDGFYDIAETELTDFLNNYPNSVFAPEASLLLLKSLFKQEKFKESVVKCKEFIFKYPSKKEEILIEWGKAEIKLSNFDSAIKVINQIMDKDKRELYLGEVYYAKGEFRQAIKHYSKSNLPYSELSIGWTYLELKDYKKAAEIFSKLKGEYKEEGSFLYAKSLFLLNDKNSEKAFLSYIENFPKGKYKGRAYSYLADLSEAKGKIEEAINYLKNIPSVDPSLTGFSYYRIGIVEYERGNYDTALEYFDSIKEGDPYFWDGAYWKGLTFQKQNKIDEAISLFSLIVKESPSLKNEALFEIAQIYKNRKEYFKAKEFFEKVKGELEDEANIEIGNILLKEEKYNEAYLKFKEVVENKKGNVSLALFQSAIAKKKMNDFEGSLSILETYERQFPEGEEIDEALLLKGDLYQNLKDYKRSLEEYGKVNLKRSPELTPYALEGKAWALMGLKKYEEAFKSLEELSERFPDFCSRAEVYLQLGNAAYAMGDLKSAERAYRQVKGEKKPEALFNLAKMFFESREYNKAIEEFLNIKRNFSLSKYSEISSYYIALSLRKKNDFLASNRELYYLISESQNIEILTQSFLLLGDNYFDQAKFDSSYKYYTKSLSLIRELLKDEDSFSLLYAARGILLSINNLKGYREMEEEGKELIRLLKGKIGIEEKINELIGDILFSSGEYNRAISYLEHSKNPESFYKIGLAFLKINKKDYAIQFLEKSARTPEFKDKAYFELGKIELDNGNINKAKEYFTMSSLAEASIMYALCLKKEGKEKEAIQKLLILRDKTEGVAYLEIAKIQIEQKNYEEALKNLEKAIGFRKTEAEAYYLTGKVLFETNKKEEALKFLLKLRYLHPESEFIAPSLYLISEIMISKKDKEKAILYLKEIIERKEEPWLTKAKEKLSDLNK
ncbi:MAG: tetratricopeptide repeat protein [candidate division WOR-3 bacterium]